jgi:hypothetical protein
MVSPCCIHTEAGAEASAVLERNLHRIHGGSMTNKKARVDGRIHGGSGGAARKIRQPERRAARSHARQSLGWMEEPMAQGPERRAGSHASALRTLPSTTAMAREKCHPRVQISVRTRAPCAVTVHCNGAHDTVNRTITDIDACWVQGSRHNSIPTITIFSVVW